MFSMFKYLLRNSSASNKATDATGSSNESISSISLHVQENVNVIKGLLQNPNDLIIREFAVGDAKLPCALVCLDGLIDKQLINEQVLKPIMSKLADTPSSSGFQLAEAMKSAVLSAYDVKAVTVFDSAILSILSGDAALFVEGFPEVVVIDSKGWKSRSIEEPISEATIRGPREGFTESIRTNTALIRRRLRDTRLRFESYTLGARSKTEVNLVYMDGITHPQLVSEVRRRLASFSFDDAQSSARVQHWITDSFLSPFPLIANSERPDKVSGALLQGRLAILVDGDPFALILPITFNSNLQSPEDYYQHWMISSFIRVLRMLGAFSATFLPALYIALLEFHHGMIPSKLAFSIAGTREGVPFPAVVEAFLMEITLELLREAGLRLPKPIGQTIGIVGGLVIGEAAVAAGIVSPIMVIVVAITAISSFCLPSYSFAISIRLVRFGIMLMAAILGFYGIILGYIMINIHFVHVKSFGIPYSTPFAPFFLKDWKDLVFKAPGVLMRERPEMLQPEDSKRME